MILEPIFIKKRKEVMMVERKSENLTAPKSLAQMAEGEFREKMTRALAQAQAGEGMPADDFFFNQKEEVMRSHVG